MFIHIKFSFNFVNNQTVMQTLFRISFLALCVIFVSCTMPQETAEDETVSFKVQRADEWTSLFKRSHGWFGGDGIFAIPFSGDDRSASSDSILFLFSDTMVGEISNDSLLPGYTMVNNSCLVLRGKEPVEANAKFLVKTDSLGKPSTLFVPSTPGVQKEDYYWLGDGFVNTAADSSLYIFAYRIRNTTGGSPFPFREVGNALIVIPPGSKYPFANHRQLELSFSNTLDSLNISLGAGVHADGDGFIYIYGIRGRNKELIAARTKAEAIENFDAWEFYNGDTWSGEISGARAISDSVSNELSVTPIGDGKYALIYQYSGIMPTIFMQIGSTPVGPFGPRLKVWDTTADINEKDLFTYNAKAHPAISKPGELLVSYNVNSFDFVRQISKIPDLYRPRFIRITFENN